MSTNPSSVLSEFVTEQARSAVVRLRDPSAGDGQVFTGFFIAPDGLLLTVFHALRHELWDMTRPADFELELDFDATRERPGDRRGRLRVRAVCPPEWRRFPADWALLRLDYRPAAYLPMIPPDPGRSSGENLLSELRSYGFTATQQGPCRLGAFSGQYARPLPERGQFRLTYVNRGLGQSGSPVIEMSNLCAVGVLTNIYDSSGDLVAGDETFGPATGEVLTCDAAVIDHSTLAPLRSGIDLVLLAERWRSLAVQYLCDKLPEFGMLSSRDYRPSLPDRYVSGRRVATEVGDSLLRGRTAHALLHGPRGSGKTSLALEIVEKLSQANDVDSIFWYDFDPEANRNVTQLIRKLMLHLALHQGTYGPLEAYSFQPDGVDQAATVAALVGAVAAARHALVFENVHVPQRDGDMDVLALLSELVDVAGPKKSKVILTSWDQPHDLLRIRTYRVDGLTDAEVDEFFRLHEIELSQKGRGYITEYASDLTCLEHFARSPEWRRDVEAGWAGTSEPDLLLRYWVGRFLSHVPEEAHSILLALAVLNMPSNRSAIEFVSGARNFSRTLSRIQSSPPLVYTNDNQYDIHMNVRRAVLATADSDDVRTAHQRAGVYWRKSREFVLAAEHHLAAGETQEAADLLYSHREEIITTGRILDLEGILENIRDSAPEIEGGVYRVGVILASCGTMKGEYAAAVRHLDYALQATESSLDKAMLHNRRGDNFRLASDYQSARSAYSTAADLTREGHSVQHLKERARAVLGLAKLARLCCDYTAARDSYTTAHEIFTEMLDRSGLIETEFGLGEVSRLLRDWPASEDYYTSSLNRARLAGSIEREAYALHGLGEVRRLTGDLTEAERLHREGLELCGKVGDTRSEGWALIGLAETFRADGQLRKALAAYEQAEVKFRLTRSQTEIAHAALGSAETYRDDHTIRLDLYDKAERIYRERDVYHCIVLCCLARGAVDAPGQADEYLREGLALADRFALEFERELAERMLAAGPPDASIPLNFP